MTTVSLWSLDSMIASIAQYLKQRTPLPYQVHINNYNGITYTIVHTKPYSWLRVLANNRVQYLHCYYVFQAAWSSYELVIMICPFFDDLTTSPPYELRLQSLSKYRLPLDWTKMPQNHVLGHYLQLHNIQISHFFSSKRTVLQWVEFKCFTSVDLHGI